MVSAMSSANSSEQTPTAEGDRSLRNFFGGLLIVWILFIALMAVIELTYG
jgi:hypothetical protein